MHERTGETAIPSNGYTLEQDCYVMFVAMFKNTNGFCIANVKDSSDNIIYTIRINAPYVASYAQSTGVYPCKKGWKIHLYNYSGVADFYPKFVLTY